jgi:Protein of unknown function (DUF1360)
MPTIGEAVRNQRREYSQGEDRPLGTYGTFIGAYGLAVGAGVALARRTGRRPLRPGPWDVALMMVTTHKIARILAKAPVTSPIRAPFMRYEGASGPSELAEEARGTGVRHAVGELLSCPFCLAQWVGSAYAAGLTFAPNATRLAGATVTAVAGADWLQLIYQRLQQAAQS